MVENDIGFVVTKNGKPVGILTERDNHLKRRAKRNAELFHGCSLSVKDCETFNTKENV
jgi:hypothetical protein